MRIFNNRNISLSLGSLLFFFLIFTFASRLMAQDVVLNPGHISGQIQVGNEVLSRYNVSANFSTFNSSKQVNNVDSTSASYDLTVNVPEGTTPDYRVNLSVWMDSNFDRLWFPQQITPVTAFETSTVDFVLENPGFIEGVVTVSGGGSWGGLLPLGRQERYRPEPVQTVTEILHIDLRCGRVRILGLDVMLM